MDEERFQLYFSNEVAPRILEAYNLKAENGYTERIGTIDCQVLRALITEEDRREKPNVPDSRLKPGCPASTTLEDKYERSEFVAEHEGRSAFLYGLVGIWICYLTDFDYPAKYRSRFVEDNRAEFADLLFDLMFMLMHDTGEVKGGDVADDGRAEHAKRVKDEEKVMATLFNCFPTILVSGFRDFRQGFETFSGRGAAAKVCDKIEALLFLLFLESKGHIGHTILRGSPSPGDLRSCELLGTDINTDVWCLRYRIQSRHLSEQERFPFEELLRQQFLAVRGEVPLCMTIDVTNLEIDTPPTCKGA